ncbi:MAG: hypothetical protein M3680_00645 [Myxococcota bacterium]|nr:hypothetical protein [Myxococcota bacterium]
MKILRTFTILAALSSAAYAGDTAPAPAPAKKAPDAAKAPTTAPAKTEAKKELSAQDADKFLAFFNKFVDGVVAAKEDCVKMAATINSLIDANQDLIKKANAAKAEGKDLPQAAKDKMMARVKEMMPGMQKCGADPKVQAAMKRMEENKSSAPAAKAAPAPAKK